MTDTNQFLIVLSYKDATILSRVVTMYTSGPEYHRVNKSLSQSDVFILDNFCERIHHIKDNVRVLYPDNFNSTPYSPEAWELPIKFEVSNMELNLSIKSIEITLIESKRDNFYELEVIVGYSISDVCKLLKILRETISCTEFNGGER